LKNQDHVASYIEERERVLSAGGQVKWQIDTWRVGHAALQASSVCFSTSPLFI